MLRRDGMEEPEGIYTLQSSADAQLHAQEQTQETSSVHPTRALGARPAFPTSSPPSTQTGTHK